MSTDAFIRALVLSLVAAALCVVLILLSGSSQKRQNTIQMRQEALNTGILGQQGQQLGSGVLQDLAQASQSSPAVKLLLERYGYRVTAPATAETGAATNATAATSGSNPEPAAALVVEQEVRP